MRWLAMADFLPFSASARLSATRIVSSRLASASPIAPIFVCWATSTLALLTASEAAFFPMLSM
jgi:hypothetical protein